MTAPIQPKLATRSAIIKALKTIYDPEIPVDIYELGLIYHIEITSEGTVVIQMTLTSPGCPFSQTLPGTVEETVNQVEGVIEGGTTVEIVWDPPWSKDLMSEAARLLLNLD